MGIDIDLIGDFLDSCKEKGSIVAEFRAKFPGVSLTRCDASDMGGEVPVGSKGGFDIYLVDGRDHCWKITDSIENATGVVLAERKK